MKTYIVQLEPHDDMISTRDKISWGKARRVLLVYPRSESILDRKVDLALLQRHAWQVGSQLAVVSRSSMVKEYARELGIPVFASPRRAERSAWRKPRGAVQALVPVDKLFAERKLTDPAVLRARRNELIRKPNLTLWARIGVFAVGMLAFLALVLFFLPGAQIHLQPLTRQQEMRLQVAASPRVAAASLTGSIPASPLTVTVEGRDLALSTGKTSIPFWPASAEVEITNLTNQPVSIPAGSAVLTLQDPPVRFLTLQAAKLQGQPGVMTRVPVRAAQPGTAGNVPAGSLQSLEGPLGLRVKVNNPEAAKGGSERSTPSPTDLDGLKLRLKLLDQLQQNAAAELRSRVNPGERLIAATFRLKRVLSEEGQPEVGQPGDHLSLTMRAEYEAWTVKDSDLAQLARAAMDATLPQGFAARGADPEVEFVSDAQVDLAPAAEQEALEEETAPEMVSARWTVTARRTLQAQWNREEVIQLALGRDPQEALSGLQAQLPLSAPPVIQLFPSWWARMPFLAIRIEVTQ